MKNKFYFLFNLFNLSIRPRTKNNRIKYFPVKLHPPPLLEILPLSLSFSVAVTAGVYSTSAFRYETTLTSKSSGTSSITSPFPLINTALADSSSAILNATSEFTSPTARDSTKNLKRQLVKLSAAIQDGL